MWCWRGAMRNRRHRVRVGIGRSFGEWGSSGVQDWRFDELTRTLGKATSRRQVLKGLLSGLAAVVVERTARSNPVEAASSGSCDVQECEKQAFADWLTCNRICTKGPCKRRGFGRQFGAPGLCLGCRATCTVNFKLAARECRERGCSGVEECCGDQCTDLSSDPNNCGNCGHACSNGEECVGGQCQCADDFTDCSGQCVDTQSDHENCGVCGHACTGCEICVSGQCTSICGTDAVCCNDRCVPLCPDNSAPDPTTCECGACKGQTDGTECGQNQVCCQQECVSTQCSPNQAFSYDTCNCQCTESCPPGQLQDPDTCECQDLCGDKTCGECESCDPTSGDCVPVDNGTTCSDGTCCDGACTQDGGTCCDSSTLRCYDQTGPVGPCCPTGQGCVAQASDAPVWTDYTCCPIISGSGIGEDGRPYPALPDGTCCGGNSYWVVNCPGGWTCCDHQNGLLCC
jgi:hypothetical protein